MLFVCLTRISSNTKTHNVERQLRKIQEHTEQWNFINVENKNKGVLLIFLHVFTVWALKSRLVLIFRNVNVYQNEYINVYICIKHILHFGMRLICNVIHDQFIFLNLLFNSVMPIHIRNISSHKYVLESWNAITEIIVISSCRYDIW